MKTQNIPYDYVVHNISQDGEVAYKAVIPAINGIVFGENLAELEEGIALAIDEEIRARKRRGRKDAIPQPDTNRNYSGKFVVRTTPALHERLALEAKTRGKSLNAYLQEKIAK